MNEIREQLYILLYGRFVEDQGSVAAIVDALDRYIEEKFKVMFESLTNDKIQS